MIVKLLIVKLMFVKLMIVKIFITFYIVAAYGSSVDYWGQPPVINDNTQRMRGTLINPGKTYYYYRYLLLCPFRTLSIRIKLA